MVIFFFILLPEFLPGSPHTWRWIFLYLVIPTIPALYFRKYRGRQAFIAMVILLTIALVGWSYAQWLGILFISAPIYVIGTLLTHKLAQVILPSSNPEDPTEIRQKFRILLFYLLGMQYPYWAVQGKATHDTVKRIDGDFFVKWTAPGAVWMYSHQVAGISAGIEFDNIEGPGIVFTDTYNRPIAIVDLRTQIRVAELDALTKDGVPIRPVIFTSFGIDRENWPKKGWKSEEIRRLSEDVQANPHLRQGLDIDRPIGSFPYSTGRVKAALSMTGVHSSYEEPADKIIHWDDWVVAQVKNAARRVVSQRNLNELWHPRQNRPGIGALDEMAQEIREIVEPQLRRAGIALFSSRIVNYVLPPDSEIAKQQIESWKVIWTQKTKALEAEVQAMYQEQIEKAHAYAKSAFLDAIAAAIQRARAEHP
ncbi:MAG: SPFH domain-containing protein, partial [Anaerolineales bacterium]|nr:SPFH domain-containing protein [Anaerolineales bacterium]